MPRARVMHDLVCLFRQSMKPPTPMAVISEITNVLCEGNVSHGLSDISMQNISYSH